MAPGRRQPEAAGPGTAADAAIRKVGVAKVNVASSSVRTEEEYVAVEEPLDVYLNGELAATIFSTPTMTKEHVVGYLMDEGIVMKVADIQSLGLSGRKAKVRLTFDPSARLKAASVYKVVTTACGLWSPEFVRLLDRINTPSVSSDYSVTIGDLSRMLAAFGRGSGLWEATGGLHSAAVFEDGEMVGHGEDVGRHNAVDKAVGQAALGGADFSRCVCLSTGRQPADMVLKAARVGIPIVVSNTSVIYSGVYAAKKTGVTLVGFARGTRFNIYANEQRIIVGKDGPRVA